jgi:hypothetical protein
MREVQTGLTTNKLNCRVSSQDPANDSLCTIKLEISLTLPDDLTVCTTAVPYSHQLAQISQDR